jgi:drug/metabolite transporter (DMT)-like permease
MDFGAGAAFALIAMFFWGFGDFLIQRSTKKLGDWETLLVITFFGTVVLTPFIYAELGSIPAEILLLTAGSVAIFFAALLDFEALKRGKLAIVEPVLAFEVPLSLMLAFFVLKETITFAQGFLVCIVLLGLILLSQKSGKISKVVIEKGFILGIGGALLMGTANFLIGYGSRATSPLMVNWFMNVFITAACVTYLATAGRLGKFSGHVMKNKKLLFSVSFFDNGAWIAYAFAVVLAPIGIVVSISESYVAIGVLLGLSINHDKIKRHQKAGLVLALAGAIMLAAI